MPTPPSTPTTPIFKLPSKYTPVTQIEAQWERPGLTSLMVEKPILDCVVNEYAPDQRELTAYQGSNKLRGKTALITGGDSGVGASVAVLFAKEGAKIAFTYCPSEEEDAMETKDLIESFGTDCLAISADLRVEEACTDVIEKVVDNFGNIDILVLNHGEQHMNPDITTITADQIRSTFDTNIVSFLLLAKYAVPHITSPGGKIIASSSITTFRGSPELVDYTATKGAILGFVRSLAKQLVPKRIRVNAVAFSSTLTPLQPISRDQENLDAWMNTASDDLGRVAHPCEVAPAFVYLASCESSCVNGTCIPIFNWDIVNN